MISDQPSTTTSRLALKPAGSARGHLDGGWWPSGDDLPAEIPALQDALRDQVGPVGRISYHLDAWPPVPRKLPTGGRVIRMEGFHSMSRHLLVVIGVDYRRATLLVVPHGTPGGVARALLRSAARPESTETADEILAGNGAARVPLPRAETSRQRWETEGGRVAAD